ncbi:MAG: CBS domain-containing protein [Planctomycetes bacterium]|nr:CBS domain-containing protein [Planctomycetota bacterium]
MKISDLCGQDFVIGTGPEMTIRAAAERMAEEGVGCLVVVERTGAVAGVITDRDIVVRVVAEGQNPDSTRVADAMSEPPVTISHTANVEEAASLMRETGVRRLPVIDRHGKAVAVVSLDDLLIAASTEIHDLAEVVNSARRTTREPQS